MEYKIFSPSGNDTAIISKKIISHFEKSIINAKIMEKHKNVEQVGFVYIENGVLTLLMAGGEFCGNATRCAIYDYLKGETGHVKIKVSGANKIINGYIDNNYKTYCEIPIKQKEIYKNIDIINDKTSIVKIDGITFIVIREKNVSLEPFKYKKIAFDLLKKYDLLENVLASGVIFLDDSTNISIKPVVWVNKIKTLFYETACGSGTVASGIDIAFRTSKNFNGAIYQPSNDFIICNINLHNDKLLCEIGGNVKEIYRGILN